jgi:hypothetical protein
LYEQAIHNDRGQLTGSVNLRAIRMERGGYAEAIHLCTGDRAGAEAELAMASAFEPRLAVPDQLRRELR